MSPFGEGVMLANMVWLAFHWWHRRTHLCMPKEKCYVEQPDGSKTWLGKR